MLNPFRPPIDRRRPRRRCRTVVAALITAASAVGGVVTFEHVSAGIEPAEGIHSTHALVIAQGVIEVGTAPHVWALAAVDVTGLVELPGAGPKFVVPMSEPTRVGGGDGHGALLAPGEATFVHSGYGYSLETTAPSATVLELGIAGGDGENSFPLDGGLYDFELVADTLSGGEALPVGGSVASMVVVVAGNVTLPSGEVLPAGYNAPLTGDFVLDNQGTEPARVMIATLAKIDTPTTIGAPLPPSSAPVGAPAAPPPPGASTTPGSTSPPLSSSDEGVGTPTPGSPTSIADSPDGPDYPDGPDGPDGPDDPDYPDGPDTTSPGSPPPTTTIVATTIVPTTTTPPTTVATTLPPTTEPPPQPFTLTLASCTGGPALTILVHAAAGNGYKRDIRSVQIGRDNEYGNYNFRDANWIGEDTAQHYEWKAVNVIGSRGDMGRGLQIVATSTDGRTETISTTLDASC